MRRARIFITGALLLCRPVLHSIAGEVRGADEGTAIHVRVASLPDPNRIDPASRAALAALNAFKAGFPRIFEKRYRARYEAHPEIYGHHDWSNVQIVLEPFTGIRVEGVESDLLAIAGGMAPDVIYLNFRKSDNYIRQGFLHPLDDYFAELGEDGIAARVNPRLWPVIRRKGPGGETHIWALPYDGALGKVLLYRKDLFDELGIPHPDNNWTWNDLLAASRAITDPAAGRYGFFLSRGKHESWYWLTFLWSAGGEVMEYDETADQWRCVFDSREAAVALDFYTRLSAERWVDSRGVTRRGYSAKDAGQVGARWSRGEIGMMFAYIDEKLFADIDPEVTGMAPVPYGPTGLRAGEINSKMAGLFAGIESPVVRDAAWEYMRFLDSTEALRIKTDIMVSSGLGPFVNPRYLEQFGHHETLRLAPAHLAETFRIAIETGRPEPYGRNSNFAYELMTLPIAQAEQLALNDELPDDIEARLDLLQGLLAAANRRANEIMMNDIPPGERRQRNQVAGAMLALLVAGFFLSMRRIARAFRQPETGGAKHSAKAHLARFGWAYLLLVPALAAILVWKYLPLARGAGMAFLDYRLMGQSAWIGLEHFGNMLYDSFWWRSVYNALRYSALTLALTFIPPVILAVLLQEIPRGKRLFRLLYYLPAVVSGLITIILWKQFYEPSERGLLNALVMRLPAWTWLLAGALLCALCLGFAARLRRQDARLHAHLLAGVGLLLLYTCARPALPLLAFPGENALTLLLRFPGRLAATAAEPVRWLSNPDTAMLACVIPMVWAGAGPGCLIYLAALKCIPEEYYEAAEMDGAGFLDKILFVVLPHLKVLLIINFVGVFIASWYNAAGNILVMTGGAADTEVAGLHIWFKAFTYLQFGPATAMAWMLGVILIGFTVHQLTILSKVEFKTTNAA